MPWYCYKPGGYNTMWLSNPSSQDTQTNLKAASETRCRRGSNRPVDPDRTACHLVPPRHSNITVKKYRRPTIVAIGLFGAALIYGDGAITPALSVLSAPEGLNIATPALKPHVLPAAVAILVALFAIQPLGTVRIGKAFGPIMAVWFFARAILGLWGISRHPAALVALNPMYGIRFLFSNGFTSFLNRLEHVISGHVHRNRQNFPA